MPDVFTHTKRSEVMSRIRGHGNKDTELALIRLFRLNGITGWRRRYPLFGKPDFVFPKLKLAIFVDGCFWHCCPKHSNLPVNNRLFWERKLEGNRRRDRLVSRRLRAAGWRVVRVWEHELSRKNRGRLVGRIARAKERSQEPARRERSRTGARSHNETWNVSKRTRKTRVIR
ncbi:MAG: mismatch repair protein Vsr [Phycisphaerales bacterium]|nr:mismatch repair protein Vsr [Phycisphaerales bacterium]